MLEPEELVEDVLRHLLRATVSHYDLGVRIAIEVDIEHGCQLAIFRQPLHSLEDFVHGRILLPVPFEVAELDAVAGRLGRIRRLLLAARAAIGEEGFFLIRFDHVDLDVLVAAGVVGVGEDAVLVHVRGPAPGLLGVADDPRAFGNCVRRRGLHLEVVLVVLDRVFGHGSTFGRNREPPLQHQVEHADQLRADLRCHGVVVDLDAVELHLDERALGRRHLGELSEFGNHELHALRRADFIALPLRAVHAGLLGRIRGFPCGLATRCDQGQHLLVADHGNSWERTRLNAFNGVHCCTVELPPQRIRLHVLR